MQTVMYELANFFGFDYMPETFPEFFTWIFLAMAGVIIICCIIRMMFYVAFKSRKLV